jgi:ribosome-binding protein aMBF1 (putative translation factor)
MSVLFHRRSVPSQGIRSDAERERALAQVAFFRAALDKVDGKKPSRRNADLVRKCESMLRDREAEIRDYDKLRNGELDLPKLKRLNEIGPLILRIRIARGVSQTELARRLGVSKQVISRYEEFGYESAGISRLQEILDALQISANIALSPNW